MVGTLTDYIMQKKLNMLQTEKYVASLNQSIRSNTKCLLNGVTSIRFSSKMLVVQWLCSNLITNKNMKLSHQNYSPHLLVINDKHNSIT